MPSRKKRLEWHEAAILELAESLAWYRERNPTAASRMRKAVDQAARSLIAATVPLSGRLGVVAGTRERVVGNRIPFTLVFVRDSTTGDCTIYRCIHQRRRYPEEAF
ncbi:MAG: type II toxin-antitoxin system RelE/ParE family toxin [Sulfurisoma sp.]|nr:type II toxin-antitoxin system RelE/ParE family toxin [Sulfurisoma sp.]